VPTLALCKERRQGLGTQGRDILSKPFPGHKSLTPRERVALGQIVSGSSSNEAARRLGISPRTVEFHRANVMRKLGAKNTADLVRRVLGE
jgi:DNA-binding CsgD family transcriptional regulator